MRAPILWLSFFVTLLIWSLKFKLQSMKKTAIGLISKKAILHVQHTSFVHLFAVVLHDYNVKLPETSQLQVLWRKCRTCSCSTFFFHCRSIIFTLVAASTSHFPTATTKFSCFSSNKKNLSFAFFSRASSLSLSFSLSFAGLSPTLSLSLSLHGYRNNFRFPFSSLLTL